MGYDKEIVLYKKQSALNYSPLQFLESIKNTDWQPTYYLIDRGNEFDWVHLPEHPNRHADFLNILSEKTLNEEYIAFSLIHQSTERYITVDISKHTIALTLDIRKNEDEPKWFNWHNTMFVLKTIDLLNHIEKIEWRSGYDNSIVHICTSH